MMAAPALRPSWSSSRTRPTRLIIPITAALAALYLTLRYSGRRLIFRGPETRDVLPRPGVLAAGRHVCVLDHALGKVGDGGPASGLQAI